MGWLRDLPDFRDYTPEDETIKTPSRSGSSAANGYGFTGGPPHSRRLSTTLGPSCTLTRAVQRNVCVVVVDARRHVWRCAGEPCFQVTTTQVVTVAR